MLLRQWRLLLEKQLSFCAFVKNLKWAFILKFLSWRNKIYFNVFVQLYPRRRSITAQMPPRLTHHKNDQYFSSHAAFVCSLLHSPQCRAVVVSNSTYIRTYTSKSQISLTAHFLGAHLSAASRWGEHNLSCYFLHSCLALLFPEKGAIFWAFWTDSTTGATFLTTVILLSFRFLATLSKSLYKNSKFTSHTWNTQRQVTVLILDYFFCTNLRARGRTKNSNSFRNTSECCFLCLLHGNNGRWEKKQQVWWTTTQSRICLQ